MFANNVYTHDPYQQDKGNKMNDINMGLNWSVGGGLRGLRASRAWENNMTAKPNSLGKWDNISYGHDCFYPISANTTIHRTAKHFHIENLFYLFPSTFPRITVFDDLEYAVHRGLLYRGGWNILLCVVLVGNDCQFTLKYIYDIKVLIHYYTRTLS